MMVMIKAQFSKNSKKKNNNLKINKSEDLQSLKIKIKTSKKANKNL